MIELRKFGFNRHQNVPCSNAMKINFEVTKLVTLMKDVLN